MANEEIEKLIEEVKEDIVSGMEKFNVCGLSIAIVEKEGILWRESFGFTDETKQQKVTPDTKFLIGSLSKAYNAVAFLRAMQKGLIHLDDPLRKYYPEFTWNTRFGADEVDKITFRHLLTHYGGLQHNTFMNAPGETKYLSFEEYIQEISNGWQKHPVGTRISYSNAGVDLVAYTLQKISGKSYAEYMTDEVYTPLGMNNSFANPADAFEAGNCARGFRGSTQTTIERTLVPILGAGAHFSSVNDMANFLVMHLNQGYFQGEKFLDMKYLEEMYSIPYDDGLLLSTIGLGIGVSKNSFGGQLMCSFFGDGPGYVNFHMFYPKLGIGMLVQANQVNGVFPFLLGFINKIYPVLVKSKLGELPGSITITDRVKLPPKIDFDSEAVKHLQGLYVSRMTNTEVKLQNNKLIAVLHDKEYELVQHSTTVFSCERFPSIKFDLDSAGKPVTIELLESIGVKYVMDYESGPEDSMGPNKQHWSDYSGLYLFNKDNIAIYSTTFVKNGYLHLVTNLGNRIFRLTEYQPNIFFTADGQNVSIEENQLLLPNFRCIMDDITLDKINHLIKENPDNFQVSKASLEELLFIYETTDPDKAKALKNIISQTYPEDIK